MDLSGNLTAFGLLHFLQSYSQCLQDDLCLPVVFQQALLFLLGSQTLGDIPDRAGHDHFFFGVQQCSQPELDRELGAVFPQCD